MATDNVVEILLAYGFSKEESEKAARLAAAYLDETQKKALSEQEKYWAKIALEDIANAKELLAEKAKLQAEAAKEAADDAIAEEKRVTEAAKTEYEERKQAQTKMIKEVGLAATGVAAATAAVLYKAVGLAQKYIDATEENNTLTERWAEATKDIDDAQLRIGKVLAQAILPVLETAADIVEKVAAWMEANPEAVNAGLKGIAAISVMATIVASLSATILVAQKTALILKAIEASKAFGALTGGYGIPGGAIGPAVAGQSTATLVASTLGPPIIFAIAAEVTRSLGNVLAKSLGAEEQSWGDIADTAFMKVPRALSLEIAKALEFAGLAQKGYTTEVYKFGLAVNDWVKKLFGFDEAAATAAKDTEKMTLAAQAYGQMMTANAAAVASAAQQVEAVNATYEKNLEATYAQHAKTMGGIAAQLSATLGSIEANYTAAVAAAAQAHVEQEAAIIAQGADAVEQIIADSQARLEELAKQHARNVENLTNARDALGLAQENRDYKDAVSEEKKRAQEAIAAAKKATAAALAELDKQYAAQQAAAQAAYEAEQAAAIAQAAEERAAEMANYAEKLKQLEQAKEDELKAIDAALKKELAANKRAFIDRLNALGVYLGEETKMYEDQQTKNLADMTAFVTAMIAQSARLNGTPTTAPVPGLATGGYASGLVRTGENGREFILTSGATRMAESMLGGSLTQERLLSGLSGGSSRSITLNDHRRFDSRLSVADRNMIREDAEKLFDKKLGIFHG